MYELPASDFNIVNELIRDQFHCHHVFVYSVLDRNQPGKVYVNSKANPLSGLIIHRGGYYYAFGDTTDEAFVSTLVAFLKDRTNHSNYYDLYVSSMDWINILKPALEGNVVQLTRSHYILNDEVTLSDYSETPGGYQLVPLDRQLFNKYRDTMDTTYSLLWESDEQYVRKAFGFCLTTNGEFASVCNTFFVGGRFVAPDIVTVKKYREMGLASIVCNAFITKSRQLGLTPYWDCDAGNEASNRLAKRLGFTKAGDLPILWWHENPKVTANYLKKFNYTKF